LGSIDYYAFYAPCALNFEVRILPHRVAALRDAELRHSVTGVALARLEAQYAPTLRPFLNRARSCTVQSSVRRPRSAADDASPDNASPRGPDLRAAGWSTASACLPRAPLALAVGFANCRRNASGVVRTRPSATTSPAASSSQVWLERSPTSSPIVIVNASA